jgi:hypothetical protein
MMRFTKAERSHDAEPSLRRGILGVAVGLMVAFVSATNALDPSGRGWEIAEMAGAVVLGVLLLIWVVDTVRRR